MKKRAIVVLITLSILVALSPPSVFAASDNTEIIITSIGIKEGEKAPVTVSLSTNPKVTTFSVVLKYDPGRLTVDNYDWGHSVNGVPFLSRNIVNDSTNGKIKVSFMSLAVLQNAEELIKVTFIAKNLNEGEQRVQTRIERLYEGYYTGFLIGESTMKYNLSANCGVITITAPITEITEQTEESKKPNQPESPKLPGDSNQPESSKLPDDSNQPKSQIQPDNPEDTDVPDTVDDPASIPITATAPKTIKIPETNWSNPFKDVSENDWFFSAVQYVFTKKLMIGTTIDTFSWDKSLTRAMIVTILYRLYGSPNVSEFENPFIDVRGDLWYAEAVKWASINGIALGYGNGKFGPDDSVTNEQLAVLIYRIQKYSGYAPTVMDGENEYRDWHNVSTWAKEAAELLLAQGLFSDIPGTTFDPQSPATRAGIASILFRYSTL